MHASDCGSVHCNGCVVNGISARTASMLLLPNEKPPLYGKCLSLCSSSLHILLLPTLCGLIEKPCSSSLEVGVEVDDNSEHRALIFMRYPWPIKMRTEVTSRSAGM